MSITYGSRVFNGLRVRSGLVMNFPYRPDGLLSLCYLYSEVSLV